ncbi:MAG: DUF2993 domain-containing protein [Cyanobacteriota bacterium]|nr:DUF2993 domain-containing protein [Cyanobacteriota bacterium]
MTSGTNPSSQPPDGQLEDGGPTGPLLGLLARGLEVWLRQQCQRVSDLEIRLEGSMGELLRGQVQGVRLTARRVVFQNLSFERVDLRSDPIQIRVGGLLRGQRLRLEHPFRVRGSVALTGEGLSRSLATPDWQGLGDQLGAQFLGVTPLESVGLEDERLILRALAENGVAQVDTRLVLTAEGMEVRPLDGRPPLALPMDPAIQLERAEVCAGLMELAGEAWVRP